MPTPAVWEVTRRGCRVGALASELEDGGSAHLSGGRREHPGDTWIPRPLSSGCSSVGEVALGQSRARRLRLEALEGLPPRALRFTGSHVGSQSPEVQLRVRILRTSQRGQMRGPWDRGVRGRSEQGESQGLSRVDLFLGQVGGQFESWAQGTPVEEEGLRVKEEASWCVSLTAGPKCCRGNRSVGVTLSWGTVGDTVQAGVTSWLLTFVREQPRPCKLRAGSATPAPSSVPHFALRWVGGPPRSASPPRGPAATSTHHPHRGEAGRSWEPPQLFLELHRPHPPTAIPVAHSA